MVSYCEINRCTLVYRIELVMRIHFIASIVSLFSLFAATSGSIAQPDSDSMNEKTELQGLAKQWMTTSSEKGFIENQGQMVDMNGQIASSVLFKTEAPGLNLWITETGMVIQTVRLRKEPIEESELTDADKRETQRTGKRKTKKFRDWERIDLELSGASIKRENIVKEEEGGTNLNFFHGHCPDGIYGVKEFKKIVIENVYPNIDWVIYRTFSPNPLHESGNAEEGEIKYDFIVHPGADYKRIELLYRSKTPIALSNNGQLEFFTDYGNLSENRPVSFYKDKIIETQFQFNYQKSIEINGEGGYETSVKFALKGFDAMLTTDLIIDPEIQWATFYGGNDLDGPQSITTDNNGNVFVTGYTGSSDFPVLAPGANGYFQGTISSSANAFILKFSNNGVRLWATYYGGNVGDTGYSIAADSAGNIFVTGWTRSLDLPTQNPGGGAYYQGTFGLGFNDAFILKFNNDGVRLWATYYGGSGHDFGYSIATDNEGNVFVTGETRSADLPTMDAGGGAYYQGTYTGGDGDAFILKFNNAGVRQWATYYGGSGVDMGYAITTDHTGKVLLTGQTISTDFPTQSSATGDYNQTYLSNSAAGYADAFILKFNNTGVREWATYYGGFRDDYGYSIAADGSGNVFVTGQARSTDLPVLDAGSGAYFQGVSGGLKDVFILKFSQTDNRLWATYYGGSRNERQSSYDNLAIDGCGNVYMSFHTNSMDLPSQPSCDDGYFDDSYNGGGSGNSGDWPPGGDIAIVLFSNSGVQRWATLVGGNGGDMREAMALDTDNNLFVTGEWTDWSGAIVNSSYPLANYGGAYYDPTFNGGNDDGFMMKFTQLPISVNLSIDQPACGNPCDGSAIITLDGSCSFNCQWSDGQITPTAEELCDGAHTVVVYNEFCVDTTIEVIVESSPTFTVSTSTTDATCGGNDGTATANILGGAMPFTANWMPGNLNGISQTGLAAGVYTVNVVDSNGCEVATQAIVQNPNAPDITLASQSDVSCVGGNNGSASINVSGGQSPYSFSWFPIGGDSLSAINLLAGNYTVVVTDAVSCSSTLQVSIDEGETQLIVSANTTASSCMLNNGTGLAIASEGVEPYAYTWEPGGLNGAFQDSLFSGTYVVTATDALGCQAEIQCTVAETDPLILEIFEQLDATCPETSDGSISVGASGAQPPYSYLWLPSGGNDSTANNLSTGAYNLIVTDANGCQLDTVVIIGSESEFDISVSWNGDTLISSGGAVYYQWYLNGQPISGANEPTYVMAVSGNYHLLAIDMNGCEMTSDIFEATVNVNGLTDAHIDGLEVTIDPIRGYAFIDGEVPVASDFKWMLLDITGRQLMQGKIGSVSSLHVGIPMHEFSSGLYLVSLEASGVQENVKLVWVSMSY